VLALVVLRRYGTRLDAVHPAPLGAEPARASIPGFRCLSPLQRHGLAPNPHKAAIKKRLSSNASLWHRRPLDRQCREYAVADVSQLLELRRQQAALLGSAGSATVEALSGTHAEWHFEEGDRSYARGGGRSFAAAAKLPLGCNMQLLLGAPEWRPRWAGRGGGCVCGCIGAWGAPRQGQLS